MATRKIKEVEVSKAKKLNYPLWALGLVIVVLVVLLGWRNKGLFIVAMVDGRPVTRWELESKMVNHYGNTTLEEIVNEKIVREAAAKRGIKVIGPEIDAKEQEIRKRLGDQVSLEQALAQQKMTLAEFRGQMELQVLVEKLVATETAVTDQEVADYLVKNKEALIATEEAAMKEEAKTTIFQQKVNEAFGKLFSDLKANTPVLKFL